MRLSNPFVPLAPNRYFPCPEDQLSLQAGGVGGLVFTDQNYKPHMGWNRTNNKNPMSHSRWTLIKRVIFVE